MNTPAPQNTQSGAAMLGIVLVIVVILLALVGALAIGPQLQNITTERQTVKRANVIVDAVRQYYLARGELPEPSSVPVDDLNLEQKYKYDAWGQEWEYEVRDISDIIGIEYEGQRIAGVLISGGPDQESGTTVDKTTWKVESSGDEADEDIVIPINVQAEAIQIARDELNRLSRFCPVYNGTSNELIHTGDIVVDEYEIEWGNFLERTGFGTAYQYDPWMNGGDDQEYRWESTNTDSVPPGDSGEGRWVSLGSEPEVQPMYGRIFECDYNEGLEDEENGEVSEPALYLDFGGDIDGVAGNGNLTPGSHYNYNGLVIHMGGTGDTFSNSPSACPESLSDGTVPDGIMSTGSLCLYFNGTSDFLWVADDDFFNPDDSDDGFSEFTLAAWMRADDPQNDWAKLISRRSGSNFYFLGANNSSSSNVNPYGAVGDGSGWTKVPTQGSPLYNGGGDLNLSFYEWYHVAVTYNGDDDGSELKFYKDGELIVTQGSDHDLVGLEGTKLLIGADGSHDSPYHFFRGYMADPVIWKEALTEGQIEQVYNGDY